MKNNFTFILINITTNNRTHHNPDIESKRDNVHTNSIDLFVKIANIVFAAYGMNCFEELSIFVPVITLFLLYIICRIKRN